MSKDGAVDQSQLQFLKGIVAFWSPNKSLIFLRDFVKRFGDSSKVLDEPSLITAKPNERSHFIDVIRSFPVANSSEFVVIWGYPICTEFVTQVRDCLLE